MAKKSGNTKVLVTEKEYKKMKRLQTALATDFALAGVYTALRDTYGFGQKRLVRLHEKVHKLFEEIDEGRIDLADLYQMIQDECGITFQQSLIKAYAMERKKYEELDAISDDVWYYYNEEKKCNTRRKIEGSSSIKTAQGK